MSIFKVNTIAAKEDRVRNLSSLGKKLLLCGNNAGNAVFFDALDSEIIFDDSISIEDIPSKMKGGDVCVFPAANWINQDAQVLKAMFLPLEDMDIQIVVIGLGIQLPEQERESLKDFCAQMDEDVKRALKIMSEHTNSIGVRGHITAECLHYLGIHNVDVVGCPSFYSDGILAEKRMRKKLRDISAGNVCFNITPGCRYNAEILSMAMQNHCLYMMQSRLEFYEFIKKRMDERGKEDKIIQAYYNLPDVTLESVQKYSEQYGRICWSDEMWQKIYSENDISFTFGNRFHGNMMSYLLGIPALWINHDLRTRELIELFQLPHIQESELVYMKNISQLKEKCIYPEAFWENRIILFEKYIKFLEKNCLQHCYE